MKNPVKFGKYYLLERISVGGMAEVFKAKSFGEAGFERLVAVKRILPSIAEDHEFIAMFVDEAKLAVQLTHPNIAQIFELGKVGEAYFIALEYVGGKDMRAIFERAKKRNETLPIPMACFMVMKLCEGLDYAHNKKDSSGRSLELVHRDVSPQNILVSYDGDVKLIDFGIAKAASKSSKTQAGILKGKFGYMSPEQVRGLQIDRRSDVFAVGICLYELLTTERLFVGESDFSTLEKVRNVEIMPPSTFNKKIPEELEQIVLKALAKHPEDRYRTAMDLHDDLQSFMYTSGNFFARKDLSAYVHKIFAEEIAKEASRDEEFRKFDARRASDLEVFENAAVAPPSGQNRQVPPPPGGRGASAPPPPPGVRNRAPTVAGPSVGARPSQAPPAPPPPNVAVSRITGSPANAPPSRTNPPVVAVSAPPVTNGAAHVQVAGEHGLDWEEEELATQIMDKPEMVPLPPPRNGAAQPSSSPPRQRANTMTGPRTSGLPSLPQISPSSMPPRPSPHPGAMFGNGASLQPAAPPLPATSLPPVRATMNGIGVVDAQIATMPAPLVASMPAIAAPAIAAPPVASPSIPAPAPQFGAIDQGFQMPRSEAPPPVVNGARPHAFNEPAHRQDFPADALPSTARSAPPRKEDRTSKVLLAVFGVIAMAALVVLVLQFTGGPTTGEMVVATNVPGATVRIDGQSQAGDGQQFRVPNLSANQSHHIEVSAPGFLTQHHDIRVAEGINNVSVNLEREAPPALNVPAVPSQQIVQQPVAPPPVDPNTQAGTPAAVVIVPPPTAAQQVIQPSPPVAVPAPPTTATEPARREPAPRTQTPRVAFTRTQTPRTTPRETAPTPRETTPTPAPSGGGGTGMLALSTSPASTCTVAGVSHSTPFIFRNVPAGTQRVSCVNNELNSRANFSVSITAGQTTREINHPLE